MLMDSRSAQQDFVIGASPNDIEGDIADQLSKLQL